MCTRVRRISRIVGVHDHELRRDLALAQEVGVVPSPLRVAVHLRQSKASAEATSPLRSEQDPARDVFHPCNITAQTTKWVKQTVPTMFVAVSSVMQFSAQCNCATSSCGKVEGLDALFTCPPISREQLCCRACRGGAPAPGSS